jgi:hypothetical protein
MTNAQKPHPQPRHEQEKNVRTSRTQATQQQNQGRPTGTPNSALRPKAPAADQERNLQPSTDQSRERQEYGDPEDQDDRESER